MLHIQINVIQLISENNDKNYLFWIGQTGDGSRSSWSMTSTILGETFSAVGSLLAKVLNAQN